MNKPITAEELEEVAENYLQNLGQTLRGTHGSSLK